VTDTSALEEPMTLGILGGTFNPPHRGHLALARHAREELRLDRVLLMPAGSSAHKLAEVDPGPLHRLGMCRLAVVGVDGVEACALEVERDGPSYTVDTLEAFHAEHPDIEVTFILGADVARTLPSWFEAFKLPQLAHFAVAVRVDSGAGEVGKALEPWVRTFDRRSVGRQPGGGPIGFLSMPMCNVSSSMVRERVRAGESIEGLVEPAVAGYIAEHGLYSATKAAEAKAGAK
jgi:nicotinate-nucleotide adenylyltransferase